MGSQFNTDYMRRSLGFLILDAAAPLLRRMLSLLS